MVGTVKVVHVRDKVPGAVYIGRAMPRQGLKASPLGNPFKVTEYAERAMYLYSDWLREHSTRYTPQREELHKLLVRLERGEDLALACWCKTKERPDAPCHGDVIKAVLEQAVYKPEREQ